MKCKRCSISASKNDKTNAIEATYILRGFASNIRHLNCSERRKIAPNEQRKQKNVVGQNAPRNEEEQRMRIFFFYIAISFPEPTCLLVSTKTRSSGIIN